VGSKNESTAPDLKNYFTEKRIPRRFVPENPVFSVGGRKLGSWNMGEQSDSGITHEKLKEKARCLGRGGKGKLNWRRHNQETRNLHRKKALCGYEPTSPAFLPGGKGTGER